MSKASRRPRAGRQVPAALRLVLPAEGTATALLEVARMAGGAGLPCIITWRTYLALVDELGGHEATWRHIQALADTSGKPCLMNGPRRDGGEGTTTIAIPPKGWSQDRLNGYVAGLKDELEAMFGETDGLPTWPGRAA